ncbi:unnamed protein product [Coccothraustes coccothraustes]
MVAFPGADFLPLRGVSLPWRRCDQTRAPRGSLSPPGSLCPQLPRFVPPPRQEGRKHRAWSGRAASSAWCDQHPRAAVRAAHWAGPAERRRSQPAWLRARACRAVVPAGGWCQAGSYKSFAFSVERNKYESYENFYGSITVELTIYG